MVKLLVSGDVRGDLKSLAARVAKLNGSAHGPFDAVFVTGGLYPENVAEPSDIDEFIIGTETFPIPLYFVGGKDCSRSDAASRLPDPKVWPRPAKEPKPDAESGDGDASKVDDQDDVPFCGVQLCPNVTYLSHSGVGEIAGLQVAWLSGTYDPLTYRERGEEVTTRHYCHEDVQHLLAACKRDGFKGVDVLLTSEWPQNFHRLVPQTLLPQSVDANTIGSLPSNLLGTHMRPRYHFVGLEGAFYQRPPFKPDGTSETPGTHVTRLIALGSVYAEGTTADKSRKYLHALNLQPMQSMDDAALHVIPDGTTDCPYTAKAPAVGVHAAPQMNLRVEPPAKRQRPGIPEHRVVSGGLTAAKIQQLEAESAMGGSSSQFFFSMRGGKGGRQQQRGRKPPPPDYVCVRCKIPGHWVQDCPTKQTGGGAASGMAGGPGMGMGMGMGMGGPGMGMGMGGPGMGMGIGGPGMGMGMGMGMGGPAAAAAAAGAGGMPRPGAPMPDSRTECWFCLKSESVEKHLLTSIGSEAYLALPKGGINEDHVLIVPASHHSSFAGAPPALQEQLQEYKDGLREYFKSKGQAAVMFERAIKTRGAAHTHMQVIGVPQEIANAVQPAFEREASKYHMTFKQLPASANLGTETKGEQYWYAEVPSAEDPDNIVRLLHIVPSGSKHPLQFGRVTICDLLALPKRKQWKRCEVPKDEEKAMAQKFRKAFAKFDFTRKKD